MKNSVEPEVPRVPSPNASSGEAVEGLLRIMAYLRSNRGCPWDREQTLTTLKPFLMEEAGEVLKAIEAVDVDYDHLKEELGDLLLQIVFQAQICQEEGRFEFRDVVRTLCDKLIRRHPHVFGDVKVSGSQDVVRTWASVKAAEKAARSRMAGVSGRLSALQQAQEVQSRAAQVGFDWTEAQDVVEKIREEIGEVMDAAASKDAEALRAEAGDLLFAVVNLVRFLGVDADRALCGAIQKFIRRFDELERRATAEGKRLSTMTLAEMDRIWNEVKQAEF